jgi:hypothetical protein
MQQHNITTNVSHSNNATALNMTHPMPHPRKNKPGWVIGSTHKYKNGNNVTVTYYLNVDSRNHQAENEMF